MKGNVTSAPILTRFNPDKPTFLKTDWSAEVMGWILMKPFGYKESIKAIPLLKTNGKYNFDLNRDGARLQPIAFGLRICTEMESKLHSFIGEAASGGWVIYQNHKCL